MITEIRTLSAYKLIRYMSENCNTKADNAGVSEVFALAAKAQESGNLTTEGLESIARKIAEIQKLRASETIAIMRALSEYCDIDFEET